jgi:hypothetical protein
MATDSEVEFNIDSKDLLEDQEDEELALGFSFIMRSITWILVEIRYLV